MESFQELISFDLSVLVFVCLASNVVYSVKKPVLLIVYITQDCGVLLPSVCIAVFLLITFVYLVIQFQIEY